jgi:hypothetical protein
MKLYTCIDFKGQWPVPVAAVVLAETEEQARELLKKELINYHLGEQDDFTLIKIPQTKCQAVILSDGDY